MMSSAIFNSLGRPLHSTAMSVARLIIVYVPLAYIKNYYLIAGNLFSCSNIEHPSGFGRLCLEPLPLFKKH